MIPTPNQLAISKLVDLLALNFTLEIPELVKFLRSSLKGNTELTLEDKSQEEFVKAYINFLTKESKPVATLFVDSDYDFTLTLPCGKRLSRFYDITIPIYDLEDLKRIKFINGKTTEVNEGLETILAYPTRDFDNTGGNRGLHYTYFGDSK